MDPLSTLGAVAAASQLIEQGYNLIKFIKDVCAKANEDAKSSQNQLVHIEQLIKLADLIKQTPSLHTDDLEQVVKTCLAQAEQLLAELQKLCIKETSGKRQRIRIAFSTVMKVDKVAGQFAALEQQKSLLALYVQNIDSTLLSSINMKVDTLQSGVESLGVVLQDTSRGVKSIGNSLSGVSNAIADLSTTITIIPNMAENVEKLLKLYQQHAAATSSPQPRGRHYLVPNRHARGFIGRQDILAKVKAGFYSGESPRVVVLRGLGGQGKTQIALQYCLKSKNEYTAIFWVDATSESTLRKGFLMISETIKTPGQVLQDSERVQFVIDSLQEWPAPWLIVFDNYDDPESFNSIQDFMPIGEYGCILVTSRHAASKALAEEANGIELLGLPEADALDLFFKQTGATKTESTTTEAEHIVKRLGYHPLAITQAGSYIRIQKIKVKNFMAHYDQQRRTILEQTPQMTTYRKLLDKTEKETAMNVFTTWELSFKQLLDIKPLGPQYADILTLFAFFDSKDISEKLFVPFCEEWSRGIDGDDPAESLKVFLDAQGQWKSTSFVDTINVLTDMSLVQSWWRDDDDRLCHLSLHPLVRDWIRLRTKERECAQYSLISAQILSDFIRPMETSDGFDLTLSTRQALLSHFKAHKDNQLFIPETGPMSDAFLLEWYTTEYLFGRLLHDSGIYEEYEVLSRHVLRGRERILGLDHSDTIKSVNQVGAALSLQMKHEEAEKLFRHNVEFCVQRLGRENQNTLASSSNLAKALRAQGKCEEAEKIHRQILEVRERLLGSQHLDTQRSATNLAIVLQDQAKYDEAEPLLRRSLDIREKVLGFEHRATLSSAWSLGSLFRRQKRFGEALPMYQRACAGYEKMFGKYHLHMVRLSREYSAVLREMDGVQSLASQQTDISLDT